MSEPGKNPAEAEVEGLEADIVRTRRSLGENVEALALKLNPDRFRAEFHLQTEKALTGAQEAIVDSVQGVTERVTEQTRAAGQGFFDMVSRHPLPTALIGAGIVLLAAGGGVGLRRSGDDDENVGYGGRYRYGEGEYSGGEYSGDYSGYVRPASGTPSAASGYTEPDYGARSRSAGSASYGGYNAYDSAGGYDAAYDAETPTYPAGSGYTAGYGGSDAYRSGSSYSGAERGLRDRAAGRAKGAGRGLTDLIESQPLIAGLVTAALGALVGVMLPGTRREDELMGSARDNLASQAREAAERAREVAQKTFDEAKETAKQEFGKIGEEVRAGGERIIQEGQEAAKKVADSAKETAKNEANKKS